jgi:hypothetical protein
LFDAIQTKRITLPHFGQAGRSATLSANAIVLKGSIDWERGLPSYVPELSLRGKPSGTATECAALRRQQFWSAGLFLCTGSQTNSPPHSVGDLNCRDLLRLFYWQAKFVFRSDGVLMHQLILKTTRSHYGSPFDSDHDYGDGGI